MAGSTAGLVAVLRAILEPWFPVACGAITIEHDDFGEAQKFGFLPESWGSAVGTPAAGANAVKLLRRNHAESGRPNVFVPGLGKLDSWIGLR